MLFYSKQLSTKSRDQLVDITKTVSASVSSSQINEGICIVYSPHTTAGITINEAYDPDVQVDMLMELDKRIPWKDGYRHSEGNSAAHIKTSIFGPSITIPIHEGKITLGTWQGIYFCEFDGPRQRNFYIQIIGNQ